jgi:PST family polysaccharide transporter
MPITTLSVIQSAILIRALAFRTQAMRRIIAVVAGGVVGTILALRGFGAWALVARFAFETLIDCVAAWVLTPWRPTLTVSRSELRELVTFGSRIVGAYSIAFLTRRMDDIVVGLVLGPAILGYFAVATRGMLLVTEVALRAAQKTALPVFSRLQGQPDRLRAAYYESIELASALASPIFVGMSAVAIELCPTLFGARWTPSVDAMRVLGFAGAAIAVSAFTLPALVAAGRPAWLFYLSLIEAALSVVTSVVAARWGLTAIAVGYVLRSYLLVPVALLFIRKSLAIRPSEVAARMIRPCCASVLMAGAVEFSRSLLSGWSAPSRLVPLVAVGALTYTAAIFLIARPTVERLIARVRGSRMAAQTEPGDGSVSA